MNINTKTSFGAVVICLIILISYSIGIQQGKRMAAKPAPVDVKSLECVNAKNVKKI